MSHCTSVILKHQKLHYKIQQKFLKLQWNYCMPSYFSSIVTYCKPFKVLRTLSCNWCYSFLLKENKTLLVSSPIIVIFFKNIKLTKKAYATWKQNSGCPVLYFEVTLFNHYEFPNNIEERYEKLGHRLKSLTLGVT